MLTYREMLLEEAERIAEIDATHFIKNVLRKNRETGEYELKEINWTDKELPNGFSWHLQRYKDTVSSGGKVFGCFDENTLVGYGTVNAEIFGIQERYILLDQLFVSKDYRRKGIGKTLFYLCAEQAKVFGAKKLFLCAGSSENTMAFYHRLGCQPASETNQKLYEEDPRDIQLEFILTI